jgi:hypothetical protein
MMAEPKPETPYSEIQPKRIGGKLMQSCAALLQMKTGSTLAFEGRICDKKNAHGSDPWLIACACAGIFTKDSLSSCTKE